MDEHTAMSPTDRLVSWARSTQPSITQGGEAWRRRASSLWVAGEMLRIVAVPFAVAVLLMLVLSWSSPMTSDALPGLVLPMVVCIVLAMILKAPAYVLARRWLDVLAVMGFFVAGIASFLWLA